MSTLIGCALVLWGAGLFMVQPPTANAAAAPSARICQAPPGGYRTVPSALPLASASDGLTIKDDGVTHYGISGNSVTSIRSALNACAPSFMHTSASGEFLAYTSYTVDWSYGAEYITPTTCQLSDVKVGLHLSQLLPTLSNESTDHAAIKTKWNAFIKGLTTHENGHKSIDQAAARAMVNSLTGLHAPCATIGSTASAAANQAAQNFITANQKHDDDTDHGVTQGAIW